VNDKVRELQLPPETMRGFMKSFVPNIGSEIVPTAAFVGGRLSEDVINVLGKREQPIQNFALFDGESLEGRIYSLYSPPPEATMPMGMDMSMGMGGTIDGMNGGLGMDMGMGMGMGMEMGLQMGMPVGGDMMGVGMPGMSMMMDGVGTGMMDTNGMMMGNGMSNGGMPDMTSGVDIGVDTEAAAAPVNEIGAGTAEEAAAPNQTVAQDPPRSVPVEEAETSGT
jgi:ubiquitin-like 1-activating enzyme E1 A